MRRIIIFIKKWSHYRSNCAYYTLFIELAIPYLTTQRDGHVMTWTNRNNMKKQIGKLYNRFRNLILYGFIGGFCAALDFAIYTLLCYFDIMPYLWANVISIHVGIFTSFILNRQINFKVKNKTVLRFVSFYTVGLVGLGISELLLFLMVTIGGMNELVCKLISIVVVALIQFGLNKYITFKRS